MTKPENVQAGLQGRLKKVRESFKEPKKPWVKRYPWLTGGIALVVAAGISIALWGLRDRIAEYQGTFSSIVSVTDLGNYSLANSMIDTLKEKGILLAS